MSEPPKRSDQKLIHDVNEQFSRSKLNYYNNQSSSLNQYNNMDNNIDNNIDNNDTTIQTDINNDYNQTSQNEDSNVLVQNNNDINDNTNNDVIKNKCGKIIGLIFLYIIVISDFSLQFSFNNLDYFCIIDDMLAFILATIFLIFIQKNIVLKTKTFSYCAVFILVVSFALRFFGHGFYRLNSIQDNVIEILIIGFAVFKAVTQFYSICCWCDEDRNSKK